MNEHAIRTVAVPPETKLPEVPYLDLEQGTWHTYEFPATLRITAEVEVSKGQILAQVFEYKEKEDQLIQQYLVSEGHPVITGAVQGPGYFVIRVTGLAQENNYRAIGQWVRYEEGAAQI